MTTRSAHHRGALLAAAALLSVSSSWAASPGASIDATYRQDRSACMDGRLQQERTSCLREAGAVRDEARRGQTARGETAETRDRNALQRCARLPLENQAICVRMVHGEGSTSGSVAGGGMIRELVTEVPAAPPMERPAPAVIIIAPAR